MWDFSAAGHPRRQQRGFPGRHREAKAEERPEACPALQRLGHASVRAGRGGEQRSGKRVRVLPPGRGKAEPVLDQRQEGGGRFRDWEYDTERPVPKFSAIRFLLISAASCRSCSACWAISSLATLEVMIKMASLQSMVFPFPSVSLPCNDTESSVGHGQDTRQRDTGPISPPTASWSRFISEGMPKDPGRTEAGLSCGG